MAENSPEKYDNDGQDIDLKKLRLYNALNQAAMAVRMTTAADQVLVVVRHKGVVTISAQEKTREECVALENLLVHTLKEVRNMKRSLAK